MAPAVIDSHAGVPGSGVLEKGQMMLVVGTSSVVLALSDKPYYGKGIVGTVKSKSAGLLCAGIWDCGGGGRAGVVCIQCGSQSCRRAEEEGLNIHAYLSREAAKMQPRREPCDCAGLAGGNKTPYVDGSLLGGFYGVGLRTKPEELYRALIEATAFGTRRIVESMEESGTRIEKVVVSGGISKKNPFFMQIYADVAGTGT